MARIIELDLENATADRRGSIGSIERRMNGDRRIQPAAEVPFVGEERRTGASTGTRRVKVERRRQIDPTTCERDYTNDEIEFMKAMDDYKRSSGRQFPTWSEVLEVVRNLGYKRD